MINRTLWLLLLIPLSLTAAETGYKVVHPDGTVEFTDDPRSGGEAIELKEAPTFKSLPVSPAAEAKGKPQPKKESEPESVAVYRNISITSPKQGQTLWFDGSGVNFTVDVQPALRPHDELVIELDGREIARGTESSFIVNGVFRGEHRVSAKVIDSDGHSLQHSEPVTFYMQRHTVTPGKTSP